MPLFGPKTKSPQDLVKALKESLGQLAKEKGEKEAKKVTVGFMADELQLFKVRQ